MTDQTNVQIVQKLYQAFGAGDGPGIFSVIAPDIDWKFNGRPTDLPYAGHFRGHAELMNFFGTVAQTAEVIEFGPHEVYAFDDKVVSLGGEKVRAKATGKIFETDWIHFFTIKGGQITRLREYYDTAAIAEAFRAG
jgi:ketosteroid isomerase-like protein